jgi:hypothetical protein
VANNINLFFLLVVLLFAWLILTRPSLSQTIFGSGILRWDEDGGSWTMRDPGIRLFVGIFVPLTVITLGLWGCWTCRAKNRQKEYWRLVEEGRLGGEEPP